MLCFRVCFYNIQRIYKEGPVLTGKPELQHCVLVTLSQITEKLCKKRRRREEKKQNSQWCGDLLFTPLVYAIKMSTMKNGNMNLTTDGEPNGREVGVDSRSENSSPLLDGY